MIFDFIKNHEKIFPIEKMCQVLEVSSSGYYRYKSKKASIRLQRIIVIKQKITSVYFQTKQLYASPRMTLELQSLGYKISRVTVAKYMKQMGLRSKLSKKFKVTTASKHNYLTVGNVLNREFNPKSPSKYGYPTSLTFIQKKDFLYLTTIIDLYDRKIIG